MRPVFRLPLNKFASRTRGYIRIAGCVDEHLSGYRLQSGFIENDHVADTIPRVSLPQDIDHTSEVKDLNTRREHLLIQKDRHLDRVERHAIGEVTDFARPSMGIVLIRRLNVVWIDRTPSRCQGRRYSGRATATNKEWGIPTYESRESARIEKGIPQRIQEDNGWGKSNIESSSSTDQVKSWGVSDDP